MGLTVLNVDIANVARPDDTRSVEFLIDSGAIYSVVPAAILDELGVQPIKTEDFRLADGSKISRRKGVALFRFKRPHRRRRRDLRRAGRQQSSRRVHAGSTRPGTRSASPGTSSASDDPGGLAQRVVVIRAVKSATPIRSFLNFFCLRG